MLMETAHLAGPNSKHTKEANRAFFSMYSVLPKLVANNSVSLTNAI